MVWVKISNSFRTPPVFSSYNSVKLIHNYMIGIVDYNVTNPFCLETTPKSNWQTMQNVTSDQGLHCLQMVKPFFSRNINHIA